MLGPFDRPPIENLIINHFRVIPKKGQANKWRLIVDLLAPDGYSVNDGINPQHCTLSYTVLAFLFESLQLSLSQSTKVAMALNHCITECSSKTVRANFGNYFLCSGVSCENKIMKTSDTRQLGIFC